MAIITVGSQMIWLAKTYFRWFSSVPVHRVINQSGVSDSTLKMSVNTQRNLLEKNGARQGKRNNTDYIKNAKRFRNVG